MVKLYVSKLSAEVTGEQLRTLFEQVMMTVMTMMMMMIIIMMMIIMIMKKMMMIMMMFEQCGTVETAERVRNKEIGFVHMPNEKEAFLAVR